MFENILLCSNCGQIITNINQSTCVNCGINYSNNNIINLTQDNGAADFTSMSENKYIGFDPYAKSYNKTRQIGSSLMQHGLVLGQAIYEQYGKNSVVLDVGAGTGYPSIEIASKGIPVIAVDISSDMLKYLLMRAKINKVHNILPVRANAYRLPIKDHSINAVTCHYIFHMFNNPVKVFQEIKRVLTENGSFYTILTLFPEHEVYVDNNLEVTQIFNRIISEYGCQAIENIGWLDVKDYMSFFNHNKLVQEIVIREQRVRTYGSDYDFIKSRHKIQQIYLSDELLETVMCKLENSLQDKYGSLWRDKKISLGQVVYKIYQFYN